MREALAALRKPLDYYEMLSDQRTRLEKLQLMAAQTASPIEAAIARQKLEVFYVQGT